MKGFMIELNLPYTVLTGLKAVDFRRHHGFPDASSVTMWTGGMYVEDIPEPFVRSWFPPSNSKVTATISTDWLLPDELIAGNGESVKLAQLGVQGGSLFQDAQSGEELTHLRSVAAKCLRDVGYAHGP
jgi:hypothetical protein